MECLAGIEPATTRWKRVVLPLAPKTHKSNFFSAESPRKNCGSYVRFELTVSPPWRQAPCQITHIGTYIFNATNEGFTYGINCLLRCVLFDTTLHCLFGSRDRITELERVKGIEPSSADWKSAALPLSYTRIALGFHQLQGITTSLSRPFQATSVSSHFYLKAYLFRLKLTELLVVVSVTSGSEGRTRTYNFLINSQALYH